MPPKRRRSGSAYALSDVAPAVQVDVDQSSTTPATEQDTISATSAATSQAGAPSPLSALLAHQEIFLRVLAFLPAADLAVAQGVSRYWQHMSVDQQLWKRLYLSRYPHPHHSKLIHSPAPSPSPSAGPSSSSGTSTPRSLRPIARLPSRAFPPPSPSRTPSISHTAGGGGAHAHGGLAPGKGRSVPLDRAEPGPESVSGKTEGADEWSGVRNDGVDWKLMLRLGTNWLNGNASSSETISLPPSPSPSASAAPSITDAESSTRSPQRIGPATKSEQFIALSPLFIFTAQPSAPLVQVHTTSSGPSAAIVLATSADLTAETRTRHLGIIPPPPGWSSPHRPDNVTAIAADQAVPSPASADPADGPPTRLAVFYQSGGFVIVLVRVTGGRLSWTREAVHPPSTRPRSVRRRVMQFAPADGDPVVLAQLHMPVLVTCTQGFHLSVYALSTAAKGSDAVATRPRHIRTLHSDVSHHPATLTLFPLTPDTVEVHRAGNTATGAELFRAALTYCTPVYPSSWTVAVQELSIDLAAPPLVANMWDELGEQGGQVQRGECITVGTEDAVDPDDPFAWPRRIKPIPSVRGTATGIGSDGRWCVLVGRDECVEVFALPENSTLPAHSAEHERVSGAWHREEAGRIAHVRTLRAHSARVTALSMAAGRCVTGGEDGRVLVWDLDGLGEDEEGENGQVEGATGRGRMVGFVEVRKGGRRVWRGAAGPAPVSKMATALTLDEEMGVEEGSDEETFSSASLSQRGGTGQILPHPQAISSAARSLFLPRPPDLVRASTHEGSRADEYEDRDGDGNGAGGESRAVISSLEFDEEKIVGIVRDEIGLVVGGPRSRVGSKMEVEMGPGLNERRGVAGQVMKVWRFG